MDLKQDVYEAIKTAQYLVKKHSARLMSQKTILDTIVCNETNMDEFLKAQFYINSKISLLEQIEEVLLLADAECKCVTQPDSYLKSLLKRIVNLSKQFKEKNEDEYFNHLVNMFVGEKNNDLNI